MGSCNSTRGSLGERCGRQTRRKVPRTSCSSSSSSSSSSDGQTNKNKSKSKSKANAAGGLNLQQLKLGNNLVAAKEQEQVEEGAKVERACSDSRNNIEADKQQETSTGAPKVPQRRRSSSQRAQTLAQGEDNKKEEANNEGQAEEEQERRRAKLEVLKGKCRAREEQTLLKMQHESGSLLIQFRFNSNSNLNPKPELQIQTSCCGSHSTKLPGTHVCYFPLIH